MRFYGSHYCDTIIAPTVILFVQHHNLLFSAFQQENKQCHVVRLSRVSWSQQHQFIPMAPIQPNRTFSQGTHSCPYFCSDTAWKNGITSLGSVTINVYLVWSYENCILFLEKSLCFAFLFRFSIHVYRKNKYLLFLSEYHIYFIYCRLAQKMFLVCVPLDHWLQRIK